MFTIPCLPSLLEPDDPQAVDAFNSAVHTEYFMTRSVKETYALGAAFAHVCALDNYSDIEGGPSLTVGMIGGMDAGKSIFAHGLAHSFKDLSILGSFDKEQLQGVSPTLGNVFVVDGWGGFMLAPNYMFREPSQDKGVDVIENAEEVVEFAYEVPSFHAAVHINASGPSGVRQVKILCCKEVLQTSGYQKFLEQASHLKCAAFR